LLNRGLADLDGRNEPDPRVNWDDSGVPVFGIVQDKISPYQSDISLPLKCSTGTLGVLGIYAHEPDAFNESEVKLLQELADDLAFGIVTLRTRTERDRIAHEQLHHVEILRQSLEYSGTGVWAGQAH